MTNILSKEMIYQDDELVHALRYQLAETLECAPENVSDEQFDLYLEDILADSATSLFLAHSLIEQQAELSPEAPALVCQGEEITYRELNQRANQVAHALRQLGVRSETFVGLYTERSLETVIGFLGILKAGAVYVPFDPRYPADRLAFLLQDSAVSVLLTQSSLCSTLPGPALVTLCLDTDRPALAQQSQENPQLAIDPQQLAYLLYTSGSTGRPKGVMVTHSNLCHYAHALHAALGVTSEDRYLHTASFAFSSSLRQLLLPLSLGATLVIARTEQIQNPLELFELIKEQHVTLLDLVPSYWQSCIDVFELMDDATRERLRENDLRLVLSASEPLTWSKVQRWREAITPGARLINMFGQTETTGIVATYPLPESAPERAQIVPLGFSIASADLFVLDENLNLVSPGLAGELYIGGLDLARGYLGSPDQTAERFLPNPFSAQGERLYRTGDSARVRPDGAVEFLGRTDYQIKLNGVRIELSEIEGTLRQHEGVQEAIVRVWDDPVQASRRLVAYVVPALGLALTSSELRHFLQGRLPEYMLPAFFVLLEKLPLTPNGKIDRSQLPPPVLETLTREQTYLAPRTKTEATLAQLLAELLHRERVGIYDDFFALGGDSMMAIRFIARARNVGLYISPRQLYERKTIATLAEVVQAQESIRAEQGLVSGPLPLTPSQRWFFQKIAVSLPAPQHFNHPYYLQLHSALESALLQQAVQHLLEHHDILRLRFVQGKMQWQQYIAPELSPLPFTRVDLSRHTSQEREAAMEAIAAEYQTRLDLFAGPIIQIIHFVCGEEPGRLLLLPHHLVVDGFSRKILLEDLNTLCQHLSRGVEARLPAKTTSYRYWAEQLARYAQTPEVREHLPYWRSMTLPDAPPLPVDYPAGRGLFGFMDEVSCTFAQDEARLLLQTVPARERVQIPTLLLAALLHTFYTWTGQDALLLAFSNHGRSAISSDIDIARTVGWFQIYSPFLLRAERPDDPQTNLQTIEADLVRAQQEDIYYSLLRYLCEDLEVVETLRNLREPEIDFNYMNEANVGQTSPDQACFHEIDEPIGAVQDPNGVWPYRLHISVNVQESQVYVAFRFSPALYRRSTIERLVETYRESLRSLLIDG